MKAISLDSKLQSGDQKRKAFEEERERKIKEEREKAKLK